MELGLLLFFVLLSLINFQSFYYKTNIQVQKYINMTYWALFIGLFIDTVGIFEQGNAEIIAEILLQSPATVSAGYAAADGFELVGQRRFDAEQCEDPQGDRAVQGRAVHL